MLHKVRCLKDGTGTTYDIEHRPASLVVLVENESLNIHTIINLGGDSSVVISLLTTIRLHWSCFL